MTITRRSGFPEGTSWVARARWIGLPFPRIDAAGTVDPLRVVNGIEPGVELGVTPPLDPDEKSMLIFFKGLNVLIGDHASVADEDDPTELEACAQVADDFLNRGMVDAIALPDMIADFRGGINLPNR